MKSAALGLELDGAGHQTVDKCWINQIKSALLQHKVVCIRNRLLDVHGFHEFVTSFGSPKRHVLNNAFHPEVPDVMILSNRLNNGQAVGIADAGRVWHSDMSFDPSPPSYTFLNAIEVPTSGGKTWFVDMERVFEDLPGKLSKQLESAKGIFGYGRSYQEKLKNSQGLRKPLTATQMNKLQDSIHPLTRIHELTGRKSLYFNESHILRICDIDLKKSDQLIQVLKKWCTLQIDYIHDWRVGDILIWDNRCVIHKATEYPRDQIRHVHRMMIQ